MAVVIETACLEVFLFLEEQPLTMLITCQLLKGTLLVRRLSSLISKKLFLKQFHDD